MQCDPGVGTSIDAALIADFLITEPGQTLVCRCSAYAANGIYFKLLSTVPLSWLQREQNEKRAQTITDIDGHIAKNFRSASHECLMQLIVGSQQRDQDQRSYQLPAP